MRDEAKSQAQLIDELQRRMAELEQDKVQYQRLMAQLFDEYEESVTEYFDIYFHDMVVSVDTETEKVLQCNRAVMETLDYSRADVVGNSIFKLYHQDCIEDAKELFRVILLRRSVKYTTPNRRCGKGMGAKLM